MVYTYKYKVGTRLRCIKSDLHNEIRNGDTITITKQENKYSEGAYILKVQRTNTTTCRYSYWVEDSRRFRLSKITDWSEVLK